MHDTAFAPMLPLRWPRSGLQEPPQQQSQQQPPPQPPPPQQQPSPPSTTPPPAPAPPPARPEVEIRTSDRRRKTATAFWEQDRIVVVVPSRVPRAERASLVEWLVARLLAKRPGTAATDETLAQRAALLADRYVDGVRPTSIRWVTNQDKRWGSCTVRTGEIRLSHRLRAVPDWVLDATIVHELAHLVHQDHSPPFHAIADRHPRQRDAAIFLEGYSLGLASPEP